MKYPRCIEDKEIQQHTTPICNIVYNQNIIDWWTKGCIILFSKKGDLRIAKNYRCITLTSKAAKIYNALPLNRIEPKIEKTLWKNQNGEIDPRHHKFWLFVEFKTSRRHYNL